MSDRSKAAIAAIRPDSDLSRAALESLTSQVPSDDVIGTLAAMLVAETPQGNPDWRARENAVKLWLSYVVGLPVQRQEIVQHKVTSARPTLAMLSDPATRSALRQLLADAEAQASKEAKTVDAESGE